MRPTALYNQIAYNEFRTIDTARTGRGTLARRRRCLVGQVRVVRTYICADTLLIIHDVDDIIIDWRSFCARGAKI